jgi:hypothetical protein
MREFIADYLIRSVNNMDDFVHWLWDCRLFRVSLSLLVRQ